MNRITDQIPAVLVAMVVALMSACTTASQDTRGPQQSTSPTQPTLEISPVQQGEDSWKIAGADVVTFNVRAPEAKSIRILYRPIVATDRYVVLKTVNRGSNGEFSTGVRLVADFAGDVWAEVSYPDGSTKETETIELGAQNSDIAQSQKSGSIPPVGSANGNSNEDARSDRRTGGKIEHAPLQAGQADIKLTVNVPSFHLTLWQGGKEVKSYEVGVGMKKYPIVIGQRAIKEVIWNPEWVPPDSEWVNESHKNVEPGEHVEAGDPRNPLGKIKIPLGDGFLMHQARGPSDLGHLVSHGCIRMLKDDILDLANNIVAARSLAISKDQIDRAMKTTDRLVARLNPPIVIEIKYDTLVVEGGVLHIYPDIYERGTSTVENLRSELQSVGVDASRLDDQTLQQLLGRATPNEEFAVNIADIKSGNALVAGANRPLTSQSVIAKKQAAGGKGRRGRGRR